MGVTPEYAEKALLDVHRRLIDEATPHLTTNLPDGGEGQTSSESSSLPTKAGRDAASILGGAVYR